MFLWQYKKLKYFSIEEVKATGADPRGVKNELMVKLDSLRSTMGRRMKLIYGGLTTGVHESPLHPKGLAADFYFDPEDGEVDNETLYKLFRAAIDLGFRGIGLYKNKLGVWSIHLDLRADLSVWTARKQSGNTWEYFRMIFGEPFKK